MHCPRCDDRVPVLRPWRGWRPARIAWWVGAVIWVSLFPIIAGDYCVMLPSFMAYLIAGGPIHSMAKQKIQCRRCSLELDGTPGGTGVRPLPRK
jgi:hypothetical protein